jgi:hypothetical protein
VGAADTISNAISYSAFDWVVTAEEQARATSALDASADPSRDVLELQRADKLSALITRVVIPTLRNRLFQIFGGRLNVGARNAVRPTLAMYNTGATAETAYFSYRQVFEICEKLQERKLGGGGSGVRCAVLPSAPISPSPSAPYTGSGATGQAATTQPSIPLGDQWKLYRGDPGTMARYKGPTFSGDITKYLGTLNSSELIVQARSLVNMCINTRFTYAYAHGVPSRGDVMRAAARQYSLDPALVGAIILVEQWDQSRNEDAADYQGAASIVGKNTSIGLGQIVVSTAKKKNLFSDLLPTSIGAGLTQDQTAALLACDEFNIFGVAKFLRFVANQGALQDINSTTTKRTIQQYPGINMGAYAQASSRWPMANIEAIASEYTSSQWDGSFVLLWSDLMRLAYQHIKLGRIL